MITKLEFANEEKAKASMCANIDRIIRVLDDVTRYAEENEDTLLFSIIEDYLNLKEV